MPSVTEIANLALTKLGPGSGYITSFETDTSVAGQAARRTYEAVRDLVLESHAWRFARKRAVLSADATAPEWGYERRFQVPEDFLRPLSIEEFEGDFEHEGGFLLCDYAADEPLNLRYLARVTETGKFSPSFVDALACRWAAELALPVTKSKSARQDLLTEYEKVCLPRARRVEHFGAVSRREPDGDFLNSRL